LWSGNPTAVRIQGVRPYESVVVVRAFVIGCAFLLLIVVGCAGVRSEAPNEQEEQGRAEATEGQARPPEATVSEEARCEKTRTLHRTNYLGPYVTNDVPGCPNGGLLEGTDKQDQLSGKEGDDEIRGLGDQDALWGGPGDDLLVGGPDREEGRYKGNDVLYGGVGSDVLHGGAGNDSLRSGNPLNQQTVGCCGKDVLYGDEGNDVLDALDGQRGELYCGDGRDHYIADEAGDRHFPGEADAVDYVDSSCEKKGLPGVG
jgi:hypothetical protein